MNIEQANQAIASGQSQIVGKTEINPRDDFTWNEYHEVQDHYFRVACKERDRILPELTEEISLKQLVRPPHKQHLLPVSADRLKLKEYKQNGNYQGVIPDNREANGSSDRRHQDGGNPPRQD